MTRTSGNTDNAGVISALIRAETLILFLSAQGVQVKSVSLRNTQPVIRIVRHAWCERMKKRVWLGLISQAMTATGAFARAFIRMKVDVGWSGLNHFIKQRDIWQRLLLK